MHEAWFWSKRWVMITHVEFHTHRHYTVFLWDLKKADFDPNKTPKHRLLPTDRLLPVGGKTSGIGKHNVTRPFPLVVRGPLLHACIITHCRTVDDGEVSGPWYSHVLRGKKHAARVGHHFMRFVNMAKTQINRYCCVTLSLLEYAAK